MRGWPFCGSGPRFWLARNKKIHRHPRTLLPRPAHRDSYSACGRVNKPLLPRAAKYRKLLNKLVLGKIVTVQKQYRNRIRAGIHNLVCGRVKHRDAGAYVVSLNGSINYLGLFDPKKAIKLRGQLKDAVDKHFT